MLFRSSVINLGAINTAAFDLILDSGTNAAAALTATSVVGTGTLTLREAGSATFTGPVNITSVALGSTTGGVTFSGNLTTTNFSSSGTGGLNFFGGVTQIANPVTILSTGAVALGNGGDSLNFNGGLVCTAASASLNGTFNTTNDPVSFAALTIGGSSSINTGTGNVTLASLNVAANSLTILTTSEIGRAHV